MATVHVLPQAPRAAESRWLHASLLLLRAPCGTLLWGGTGGPSCLGSAADLGGCWVGRRVGDASGHPMISKVSMPRGRSIRLLPSRCPAAPPRWGAGGGGVLQPWGRRWGCTWGWARLPAGCGCRCACGASHHGNRAAGPRHTHAHVCLVAGPPPRRPPPSNGQLDPTSPIPPTPTPLAPRPTACPAHPGLTHPLQPPPAPWQGRTPDGGHPRAGGDAAAGHRPGEMPSVALAASGPALVWPPPP